MVNSLSLIRKNIGVEEGTKRSRSSRAIRASEILGAGRWLSHKSMEMSIDVLLMMIDHDSAGTDWKLELGAL
jgi:hypothetical protein